MKRKSKLNWLLIISLTFIISCANDTKKDYLSNYKAFLTEISTNSNKLKTTKDWKNHDKEYKKFNIDLRKKFLKELTWQENITLAKYEVQYNTIRYKNIAKQQLGNATEMLTAAPKKIKVYVKKDMKKDLNTIVEKSKKLGEEIENKIEKKVDDTLEELKAFRK